MFKTWEELTPLEQAHCMYSDMHKDAFGFRPRHDVSKWTMDDFNAEFDRLQAEIDGQTAYEQQREEEAIKRFEKHVGNTMSMGARDRETALRWIMDASRCNGDWDFLCYENGLPYGYFRQAA